MARWLMAVDCVGSHTGSWSYIQGSTRNHENEGKTNILGHTVLCVCCTRCMLYLVYAVLGVCCTWCMLYLVYAVLGVYCTRCMFVLGVNSWSWHGVIERDALTLCAAMIVDVVDEKERDGGWRWERCGGYERKWEIWGTTNLIGLGRPRIGVITYWIGTHTRRIGNGKLTCTRNSVSPSFSWWFPPSPLISLCLVLNSTIT